MKKIHIGHIIHQKVKEKKIKISQLARKLNCNRRNLYDIFERESIDIQMLLNISEILNHNFLKEFDNKDECLAVIVTNSKKIKKIESDNEIKMLFYKNV